MEQALFVEHPTNDSQEEVEIESMVSKDAEVMHS
jgi:hypothetical protein